MFQVENMEIDIIEYVEDKCFQVKAEYVNPSSFNIHIKRLDTLENKGWDESLKIAFRDHNGSGHFVYAEPNPDSCEKVIKNIVWPISSSQLICSKKTIQEGWLKNYKPFTKFEHWPLYIGRDQFNDLLQSDIVELPSCLFALGFKDGCSYIYNTGVTENQHSWKYEIELTIDFLLSVTFSKYSDRPPEDFYCIICALDGYIEACFPSERKIPRKIGEIECRNKSLIDISHFRDNEYPVFHSMKYILGQSTRKHMPYTIPIVDRYYLCLNRYNQYRFIHMGQPLESKIGMLVYAGNTRGSYFNFMTDKEIRISQRAYFVEKMKQIKCNSWTYCPDHSLPREDMVGYKYIMDIDGNACTWDATAWKLNSGSVIFKPESDWQQWFYDSFLPWKHFVPVKDDFSDVIEKVEWCRNNEDKCIEMVKNCKELFHEIYYHPNVVKKMESVIDLLVSDYKKLKN